MECVLIVLVFNPAFVYNLEGYGALWGTVHRRRANCWYDVFSRGSPEWTSLSLTDMLHDGNSKKKIIVYVMVISLCNVENEV